MISIRTLVVGAVGAGCVAAAGLGGYLAVREGSVNSAAASSPVAVTEASVQADGPAPRAATEPAPAPVRPALSRQSSSRQAPRPSMSPAINDRPSERTSAPAPAAGSPTSPTERTPEPAPVAATAEPEQARTAGPVDEIQIASPETPRVTFEKLTVAENGVIGIRLETPVSSDTAKVEDKVIARVVRDVTVDGRVAVPAGSTFEGLVTEVERGGRFKERARLGIRFTTIVLADNTRVNVTTEPIHRTGESPTGEATAKIGAATVVGTIIGAAIGGRKGAAIGGATGAAGGTAAVVSSGPNHVMLTTGTSLTVRLTEPATFDVPLDR